MALRDLVIRSQLIPPRQQKGVLRRPRLEKRLVAVLDHPLTLVQAGTGYGKSTTVATLADTVDPLFWYTITEPDRDPLLFLAHLTGCRTLNGAAMNLEQAVIAFDKATAAAGMITVKTDEVRQLMSQVW